MLRGKITRPKLAKTAGVNPAPATIDQKNCQGRECASLLSRSLDYPVQIRQPFPQSIRATGLRFQREEGADSSRFESSWNALATRVAHRNKQRIPPNLMIGIEISSNIGRLLLKHLDLQVAYFNMLRRHKRELSSPGNR